MISTATIRSNNVKESKEKQNRERLLAGPGSEFSLSNPDFDLELDYYDYNVINAGAAPGSYLGMDPAYLVWIPPLDERMPMHEESEESETDVDEDEDDDVDDDDPLYEEILPIFSHINPGSNTETPSDEAPRLPPLNGSSTGLKTPENDEEKSRNFHNLELNKVHAVNKLQTESSSKLSGGTSRLSTVKLVPGDRSTGDSIPMQDLYTGKNIYNQRYITTNVKTALNRLSYRDDKDTDTEKETSVIKSPLNNGKEYYELDDIQFADEGDDDDDDDDDEDDDEITNALAAQKDNRGKLLAKQTQQGGDRYVRSIALSSSTSNK